MGMKDFSCRRRVGEVGVQLAAPGAEPSIALFPTSGQSVMRSVQLAGASCRVEEDKGGRGAG